MRRVLYNFRGILYCVIAHFYVVCYVLHLFHVKKNNFFLFVIDFWDLKHFSGTIPAPSLVVCAHKKGA